jgi:hypothetical protein
VSGILGPILLIAGAVLLGVAILLALRTFRGAHNVPTRAYGVERQEARQSMLVSASRAAMALMLALICFALYGLSLIERPVDGTTFSAPTLGSGPTPGASATADAPASLVTPAGETTPTAVTRPPTPTPEATTASTLVATPAASPSATASLAPTQATVNSPNGLWLRDRPGGEAQLELIPDGTVLELLPGRETAEDLEWQEVRAPSGRQGWVAVEFIIYQ